MIPWKAILGRIVLLGIVTALPLYAQSTPPGACPLEGPSLADTLKYINEAFLPDTPTQEDKRYVERLEVKGDDLILTEYLNHTPAYTTQKMRFIDLACERITGTSNGSYLVDLRCPAHGACSSSSLVNGKGKETQTGESVALILRFAVDQQKGQNLLRAFRHLYALLQKDYREKHIPPNDPFAGP